MKFLLDNNVISQITVALHLPSTSGTPIHKNRPTHGLAYNINYSCIYKFDDGTILEVTPGDCIYLPQNSNYTVIKKQTDEKHNGYFYAINFHILSDKTYTPQLFRVRGKAEIESLFSKATTAWRNKNTGFYDECFSNLYKIIKTLKKENTAYAPQSKVLDLLSPALNYINNNYTGENIRTTKLAELCNISEPYLRKLFNIAFSTSPAIYMRNLRIRYAKELIDSGEYSITDVAFISGFSDVAYFSREFKKAVGISPKEYANKNK